MVAHSTVVLPSPTRAGGGIGYSPVLLSGVRPAGLTMEEPVATKNPLALLKTVTVGALKAPMAVGRATVGTAAGAVTSLLDSRSAESDPEPEPVPVNVTEAAGIDPAPVTKPGPKRTKKAASKPVTEIDAAADPSSVTVTPADVAEVVGADGPAAGKPAK